MSEEGRLRWKCRRGMKELDVLLLHYLDRHYAEAEPDEQQAFLRILEMQDPALYFLIMGKTNTDDKVVSNVITTLRQARD